MSPSVSTLVLKRYRLTARPGATGTCPLCHRKTFTIRPDDTFGKCFNPVCSHVVTSTQGGTSHVDLLHRILMGIFCDFHAALLKQHDSPGRTAYRYCVDERGIHPRVVDHSMIGVVPRGYDLDARFRPVLEPAKTPGQAEQQPRKRGRPPKATPVPAPSNLKYLMAARQKLARCLKDRRGWIAFFYTDAAHRIVAIRFRLPYVKRFGFFKPSAVTGVFNHELFPPHASPALPDLNARLLVVEGEFNQLQLQSLCARAAEANDHAPEAGYVYVAAVGRVSQADLDTITSLSRSPVVCYDHDADGAGFMLVERLQQRTTLSALTTPERNSDLDSFIRGFGHDTARAHAAVVALVTQREHVGRPYDALKATIDDVRREEGPKELKQFEVHRRVAEIVITDLRDRGRFYQDGRLTYFFFDTDKQLVSVDRDSQELELALNRYGILPTEALYRYLLAALRLEALEHGTLTEVYVFAHYNRSTATLYLFDLGQQIYRITATSVEHVDNGTDGVLFLHDSGRTPFRLGTPQPDRSLWDAILLSPIPFHPDVLTLEDCRRLFASGSIASFFPNSFRHAPSWL